MSAQDEHNRGSKEAARQLKLLREKWPIAFPVKDEDVRPLALGATGEIAAAMGWSIHYTLSVLRRWKMTATYCNAILRYEVRIDLDGVPTEAVGARAKNLATKHLRRHMAGKSTAKLAKATAPALMAPSSSAPGIEPQKQLRERVRASLFRRSG